MYVCMYVCQSYSSSLYVFWANVILSNYGAKTIKQSNTVVGHANSAKQPQVLIFEGIADLILVSSKELDFNDLGGELN